MGWQTKTVTDLFQDAGLVQVAYETDAVATTVSQELIAVPAPTLDLTPMVKDAIVPGGVRFTWAGKTYVDRAGQMYTDIDPLTNAGTLAGTIDYATGLVTLTYYQQGANTVSVKALLTRYGDWTIYQAYFRTPGAPIRPASLFVQATASVGGATLTATADANGTITGTQARGFVNSETGVVHIEWGKTVADSSLTAEEKAEPWYDPANVDGSGNIFKPTAVIPDTVKFNCVVLSFLPLDADILGLDPVRLPSDGRVPVYRVGDVVVVHHTDTAAFPNPTAAGETLNVGRVRLARVRVTDSNDLALDPALYTKDLDAGTVTLADPLDLTGYVQPIQVHHTIEDMALLSDVEINGNLAITRQISHDFPVPGTWVSSAYIIQNLQARYAKLFHQATWTGEWSDTRIGNDTTAKYNDAQYPIAVTNKGVLQERWRIEFTGSTTFKVVGENVGQIAIGDTATQLSPPNPATGVPYFTIDPAGWGAGWSVGNVLRFNTIAANHPLWAARTVLQGQGTADYDQFRLQLRGDIDQ